MPLRFSDTKKCSSAIPTDVVTYYKLARAYFMQKQFKEAIDNSSKAIGLDSNYTQAYYLQGDIFMILGLSKVSAALESEGGNGNGYTDIFKNAIWAYEHYVATGGKETLDLALSSWSSLLLRRWLRPGD